jgi:hypothetical protein
MGFGFMKFRYDPFSRNLEALDNYGPFNTIYIKDIGWVRSRVEGARAFRVFGRLI